MLNKITKKIKKEVNEVVSEFITCDICKKELNYKNKCYDGKYAVYYHICTGHYDWGNDSCESIKYIDACCDECLSRASADWIKDEEVQASDTAYFRIEKEIHVKKKASED